MRLIGSLVIAGDVIVIWRGRARSIGGARILKLVQDDLGDCLAHGNPRAAKFPFAEVVAARVVVVVLDLAFLLGEVASVTLACEVMAVGVAAATSVRTGVRHLVPEEAMMAGNSAPAGCHDRTEMMGRLAMGGEVIVPRAVGATFALFKLLLGQGIVGGILAVPRDSTARSSSQSRVGPRHNVGVVRGGVASGRVDVAMPVRLSDHLCPPIPGAVLAHWPG